jgi:hypothetical protein
MNQRSTMLRLGLTFPKVALHEFPNGPLDHERDGALVGLGDARELLKQVRVNAGGERGFLFRLRQLLPWHPRKRTAKFDVVNHVDTVNRVDKVYPNRYIVNGTSPDRWGVPDGGLLRGMK